MLCTPVIRSAFHPTPPSLASASKLKLNRPVTKPRRRSRVGMTNVPVPSSVQLSLHPDRVDVTGPLGSTSVPLFPFMRFHFPTPEQLAVRVENHQVNVQQAMWGTTRGLIHNAIIGMTTGYTTPVYLVGVGYRASIEKDPNGKSEGFTGDRLNMKLGYSHSVYVPIPEHIKATIESPTKIVLFCLDKQAIGQFAAQIRSYRKPEPYKGKGIFVDDETIGLKSVKKK